MTEYDKKQYDMYLAYQRSKIVTVEDALEFLFGVHVYEDILAPTTDDVDANLII